MVDICKDLNAEEHMLLNHGREYNQAEELHQHMVDENH